MNVNVVLLKSAVVRHYFSTVSFKKIEGEKWERRWWKNIGWIAQ